ncbi:MAG: hypothetical protein ACREI3_01035, partial [Nitrospirales bacterium]
MHIDESRSRRSSYGPIRWAQGRYTLLAAGVVGLVVWFAVIVALLASGSVGLHEPAFRHPPSPPSNPSGLSTTAVGERTIMENDLMPHYLMSWLPSVSQELYAVSVFALVLGVLSSGVAALVLA